VLLLIIQWNKPEKSHLDSMRYKADDQFGLDNLANPSYRKCHPITILRAVRSHVVIFSEFFIFRLIC